MKKRKIQVHSQGLFSQKTLHHLAQAQGAFLLQQLSRSPLPERQYRQKAHFIRNKKASAYRQTLKIGNILNKRLPLPDPAFGRVQPRVLSKPAFYFHPVY